jgi:signal transduction histidine kinase
MRLGFLHSLKTRLIAGWIAGLAMTLSMAGLLYFGARALESSAGRVNAADDDVRDLFAFALICHRYMNAFEQSLGQRTVVANNDRRIAAALFASRMAQLPDPGRGSEGLDWASLRSIGRDLHAAMVEADAQRASGHFDAAERIFHRARKEHFEQRMLPWFDRAIEVQHRQAELLQRAAAKSARNLRTTANVLAAGSALLALFVLLLSLRALVGPIRSLLDGTTAIARGDYSHRIRYRAPNELGVLASRFDDMAEVVERSQRSLIEQNRALERAYALQGEFLSFMSHELRSPLHSILGYTELVLEDGSEPQSVARRNVESIAVGARRLLALINDILDFSRLKAGRMQTRSEPFDPVQLAQEAVSDARALAQARSVGIRVELEAEARIPELISDPTKVRQILTNLLSNAVKFCDSGQVTLSVQPDGVDRVRFRVRDTGIGIASDQLEHIFEPFRQAKGADGRVEGGTGLGLAIVSRLSELLGGEVTVASRVGEGSEFAVVLPVQPRLPRSVHVHSADHR